VLYFELIQPQREIKMLEKANKIEIKITKYNNYGTPNMTYCSGRVYTYTKSDPNFETMFQEFFNEHILDLKVFDDNDNVIYERDFEKESKLIKPDNHIQVNLYEEVKSINIKNSSVFDMVDKITNGEVKYKTDSKIDEAMHLSKISNENKVKLATETKSSLKQTSSKEDYAVALNKLNGVHPDKLKEQYSRADMIAMVNKICADILKVE
jgi:hypothetical protein